LVFSSELIFVQSCRDASIAELAAIFATFLGNMVKVFHFTNGVESRNMPRILRAMSKDST